MYIARNGKTIAHTTKTMKFLPSDNPGVLLTGKLRVDGTIFAIFLEPLSDPKVANSDRQNHYDYHATPW
jgi:hypothetical protein